MITIASEIRLFEALSAIADYATCFRWVVGGGRELRASPFPLEICDTRRIMHYERDFTGIRLLSCFRYLLLAYKDSSDRCLEDVAREDR